MNNEYRLEKEYSVPYETFCDAYTAYQKKFVYPKSRIYIALFLILAACFVYAAVEMTQNYIVYLLIVICLGLAAAEWVNPRMIKAGILKLMRTAGDGIYKLSVADDHIEFSTVYEGIEITDENGEPEPPPEPTWLKLDKEIGVMEEEKFFILMQGKRMFYVIPKDGFTEEELEIVRGLNTGN